MDNIWLYQRKRKFYFKDFITISLCSLKNFQQKAPINNMPKINKPLIQSTIRTIKVFSDQELLSIFPVKKHCHKLMKVINNQESIIILQPKLIQYKNRLKNQKNIIKNKKHALIFTLLLKAKISKTITDLHNLDNFLKAFVSALLPKMKKSQK